MCSVEADGELLTRYVMTGTLDKGPDALPPKGEFFTGQRNKWMPVIPGMYYVLVKRITADEVATDTFQKKQITS